MNLDLLALAAHPGDAEASCGGTLIRMAELGYRTGVLDLTASEPGGWGVANPTEEKTGASPLLLAWRGNQGMPEGRLENSLPARMTLAVRIRQLRPRVVILPYREANDPDQVHGSALAFEACFLAGAPQLEEYSEPHRPERILYATLLEDVRPTFILDISAQFERRCAAIAAHPRHTAGGMLARLEALARYHGSGIGVRYGEPFVSREPLAIDDLVRLVKH